MILDDILKNLKDKSFKKAYTINDKSYSYNEFYKFVCNIYHFLISKEIPNKTVVIYGEKDVYMKASFLACSFAGFTYAPIDKSMPYDRIERIIKPVKPGLIIGDLEGSSCEVIKEKEIYEIMTKEEYIDIDKIYLKSDDIYYIIFTSGSTGNPKGVRVTYRNLDSCIKWVSEITNIKDGVILNQANFSFDLSVADLYLSLFTRSEHFILDDNIKRDFRVLFNQLKKSNSTLAVFTPSFADLLLLDRSFSEKLIPNLKTIIFCGERLLNITVQKLYSRFKDIKIINTYGPTECTFAVTSTQVSKDLKGDIPIGKPKNDVDIIILDENQKELRGWTCWRDFNNRRKCCRWLCRKYR